MLLLKFVGSRSHWGEQEISFSVENPIIFTKSLGDYPKYTVVLDKKEYDVKEKEFENLKRIYELLGDKKC